MKIYLASESPRRKQLIKWMGLEVEVMNHQVDEEKVKIKEPKDLVGELALMKAYDVEEKLKGRMKNEKFLVIGSDLVIARGKNIYGKPKSLEDGKKILRELRGKIHSAWCGVAVVKPDSEEAVMSVAETKVKMKKYSDGIIDRYVKTVAVTGKAGSYGIQDKLENYGSLVESFEGGITTVIGLPLHYLENLLKEFGVKVKKDWRKICRQETGYEY